MSIIWVDTAKYLISPKFETMLSEVAVLFNLEEESITSERRWKSHIEARWALVYACRTLTNLTFEQIAVNLGGRDHTTVITSFERAKERMEKDIGWKNKIDAMCFRLQLKNLQGKEKEVVS